MLSITDAFETYENGNITDFKIWLKKAKKFQIVHITYLWLNKGYDMIKLKSYLMDILKERRRI